MRYRYPAPRLIRRIDIVTDSALTYVFAASVAESIEPPGIPPGRGTIATETDCVPDVCDEGYGLCQGFGCGQSRWWSLGETSEPGLGTARSVSHRRWLGPARDVSVRDAGTMTNRRARDATEQRR